MNPFRAIWHRSRSLWQRRRVKQEIDEELRFHIEQRAAENIAAGMPPEEAAREARKGFGNFQSVREECRDVRGAGFGEATWQDIRFGLRVLRKNPSFTVVAALTLALGIGACTAIFSVVNGVLLQRLPYDQHDQLVQLWEDPSGKGSGRNSVSGGVFADWREQNQAFQQVSALWGIESNLTGGDEPERPSGAQVSANFFELLRVRPILGRSFLPEEGQSGHEQVVILDHALWQRHFGGDRGILDRTIHLDGRGYTVIGILPPGFHFPWRKAEYSIPFGWGSAWSVSRVGLNDALKDGGRSLFGGTRQRLSRGLVAVEVALALVLLVGGGLFLRSFARLHSIDPGFKPDRVLTMQLRLPESKYPNGESKERFFRDALERIEALPGVKSAGACTSLPFFNAHDNGVKLQDRPNSEYFGADYDFATSHYFQALGIALLKGRLLNSADRGASPRVAIVNEAFVRKCLPGGDPIGKRFVENGVAEMEIVGVVGDARGRSLALPSCPHYFKPMASTDWQNFNLFVQTTGKPLSLATPVRKAILEVDPSQPVAGIKTLSGILSESVSGESFLMILSGSFAIVALLLAAIGVYGVMAYAVTRRNQEIAVRLALGAQRADVLALILRQGMATVAVGLVIGLGGTLILARLLRSLLFEISPTDPATIVAVMLLLAGAAVLACYFPAHRAGKVNPIKALKCE